MEQTVRRSRLFRFSSLLRNGFSVLFSQIVLLPLKKVLSRFPYYLCGWLRFRIHYTGVVLFLSRSIRSLRVWASLCPCHVTNKSTSIYLGICSYVRLNAGHSPYQARPAFVCAFFNSTISSSSCHRSGPLFGLLHSAAHCAVGPSFFFCVNAQLKILCHIALSSVWVFVLCSNALFRFRACQRKHFSVIPRLLAQELTSQCDRYMHGIATNAVA